MKPLQIIEHQKLIAIIRDFSTEDSLEIAKALHQGGIEVLEIAMNSPQPLQTIEKIKKELGDEITVGAGTVLDPSSAKSAISAGAQFILSPSYSSETIQLTKRHGIVSIPGAFTPTEILTAFEQGGDIIKVFPASVGGPSYIKDLLGPLPQLKLLPTGGVDMNNVTDFLDKGVTGLGLGNSLVHKTDEVTTDYLKKITKKAHDFVRLVTVN